MRYLLKRLEKRLRKKEDERHALQLAASKAYGLIGGAIISGRFEGDSLNNALEVMGDLAIAGQLHGEVHLLIAQRVHDAVNERHTDGTNTTESSPG